MLVIITGTPRDWCTIASVIIDVRSASQPQIRPRSA